MKNQNQQQIIQTPFHELEEVLKDPNTKWSEIRSALRAHGRRSCTNAAVLCALSRCNNSIEKLSDHNNVHTQAEPSVQVKSSSERSDANKSGVESKVDVLYEDKYVTAQLATNALASSNFKPTRRQSQRPSINMMDFGVDNFAFLDDSSRSVELLRRGSAFSDCTCDSEGFMGWKHRSDDASESAATDLSKECDSEGFLTWELETSNRIANATEAKMIEDALELHVDSNDESNEPPRVSFSLDDYSSIGSNATNGPKFTSDLSLRLRRMHSGNESEYAATSESITPAWKRYITSSNSFKRTVRISSPYAGTIELDDVKKALMNRVQHSSQNQNTADSDGPLQIFSKEPTTQRMCHPLLADCAASKTDNDLQDTREAIWINQKDGGLDIKKECRKLYLDSSTRRRTSFRSSCFSFGDRF
jgi:hypothetical protein